MRKEIPGRVNKMMTWIYEQMHADSLYTFEGVRGAEFMVSGTIIHSKEFRFQPRVRELLMGFREKVSDSIARKKKNQYTIWIKENLMKEGKPVWRLLKYYS